MTILTNVPSVLNTKHPFLIGLEKRHAQTLLEGAKEEEFQAGEIIFREGEPADSFYLIETGTVVLESHCPNNGNVQIQTLHDGDALGWSWLFEPFAWNFQARAAKPTRVIRCDGGHLLVTVEEDEHFGHELMKRIAHLAVQRLQAARKLLVQAQSVLNKGSASPRN